MELYEGLLSRRSVRSYTGEPLSDAQLKKLIAAGMAAPTAHDTRTMRFLSITEREKLLSLRKYSKWWQMLDKAGAAIVVMSDMRIPANVPPLVDEMTLDGPIASIENILLAAHALGLGAVWLGFCAQSDNYAGFCRELGIPEYYRVVGVVSVGCPSGAAHSEDRYDDAKWFREKI